MTTAAVPQDFVGRTALITGAGSGIGRAVTLALVARGAEVFAHDIDAERLAETVGLAGPAADRIATRAGDISSSDECRATVQACVARFGGIDVLGNVAGIAGMEHFTDVAEDRYRRMMAVNVDSCMFLTQAALPHLEARRGNVVNIASNAGTMGIAYSVIYSMTKGAIVQLTRSLAMEYARRPVRINAIAPAGVKTNIMASTTFPEDVDWDLVQPYVGFRSHAEPQDVASLFVYVASDAARNVHGAILACDGGVTAG